MIVDHLQGSVQPFDCDVAFLATSLGCDVQSLNVSPMPNDCQQIHEDRDAVHDCSWSSQFNNKSTCNTGEYDSYTLSFFIVTI